MSSQTTNEKIRIEYPTKESDFALWYDIERQPQPAGIEIDPDERVVRTYVNPNINGVYRAVQDGTLYHFPINNPHKATIAEMSHLLDQVAAYAQIVCDGYTSEMDDDSRLKGYLNDEARDASSKIEDLCNSFIPDAIRPIFEW